MILNALQNYVQRNDNIHIDDQFEVAGGTIRMPEGGARTKIVNASKKIKHLLCKLSMTIIYALQEH